MVSMAETNGGPKTAAITATSTTFSGRDVDDRDGSALLQETTTTEGFAGSDSTGTDNNSSTTSRSSSGRRKSHLQKTSVGSMPAAASDRRRSRQSGDATS